MQASQALPEAEAPVAEAWAPLLDSGTALIKADNKVKAADAVGTTSSLLSEESAPPKVLLPATCLANVSTFKRPAATAVADAMPHASNMNGVTKVTTSRAAAVDSSSSAAGTVAAEGNGHSINTPLTANTEGSVIKQDPKDFCPPSAWNTSTSAAASSSNSSGEEPVTKATTRVEETTHSLAADKAVAAFKPNTSSIKHYTHDHSSSVTDRADGQPASGSGDLGFPCTTLPEAATCTASPTLQASNGASSIAVAAYECQADSCSHDASLQDDSKTVPANVAMSDDKQARQQLSLLHSRSTANLLSSVCETTGEEVQSANSHLSTSWQASSCDVRYLP